MTTTLEPTTALLPARQLPEAELVVCPGLAANRQGDRLGRGGGWYDRLLPLRADGVRTWAVMPGISMPGEPIGIPATASPVTPFGCVARARFISAIGT